MNVTLPEGRVGQVTALALLALAFAVAWFGVAAPLIDLYAARSQHLALRAALAVQLRDAALALPRLRDEAAQAGGIDQRSIVEGATDAVAEANLQRVVEGLASDAGVAIASVESVPGSNSGSLRKVALTLRANCPFSAFVDLLGRLQSATTRMDVSDLELRAAGGADVPKDAPLEASFMVSALRSPGGVR